MSNKKIAGITAKLGLDVSGVTSALNQIEKKSKDIAREMAEVDKSLKMDPENVVLAAQKQELLAEAIKNTESKLKELESVQKKTDNAFKSNSRWEEQYAPLKEAIDSTNEKLKSLQNQNEKMQADFQSGKIDSQKYEAYQQELEATKAKMKELQKQKSDLEATFEDGHITAEEYRAYQREVESTRRQLQDLKSQQDGTKDSTEKLGAAARENGEDFKSAKSDIKSYEDAVSGLNSAVNDVSNDLKGIVTAATGAVAAVGGAAVGAVSAATEVGANFEKSMSKVEAISGATGEELAALEQAAKNMGASTSKTASESADALSYMALAGWKTEDMLTGLEPILRASEAGEMDLARCSDLVTDSMSAMGVSVNDLSHYLDVVAAAQSNSNTSMEQLLEAFVECGGSAHNFGLNVEDLSTVLGVMANRGIKGSEAGTALNSIFVNMLGSTKRTAEAMDTLGLSLYDNEGSMKDVTEVLKEMGGALATATDEQRNNLEAMLGGKTQITALQAMVNGLNGEYDDLSAALYNCDSALMDTAKTMQDNLLGNVTAMQSALEGLGVNVYDYLEEPLKSAVQAATREIGNLSESVTDGQLADVIERLAEKFGKLIKNTAEFAVDKGIPSLINSLDWLSQNGDKVVAVIEGMGAGWAAWKITTMATHVMSLVKAIKDFKVAQEAATAAQIAANEAAMANVYAVVAAAVVGLTAALAKLGAAWIDEGRENLRNKTALDETTQAMRDQQEAIDKRIDSYIEECGEIDKKTAKERALWEEIQSLVDEEGKEIEQNDRLYDAINELNTIAGTNIQIIGGQIQGYQGLKKSIDDVIASQKRQAKLKYLQTDFDEALVNIDEITKQYEEAKKSADYFNDKFQKLNALKKEYDRTGIIPEGWNRDADELNSQYERALDNASKFEAQASALKGTMDNYNSIINEYNTILREEQDSANQGGKDSGQAFGDGFSDGVQEGSDGMEDTVTTAVQECMATAQNTAEESGASVGEAAAAALKAAIDGGMKDADLENLVKQYIDDLKYEQAKLGKDDSWLYDEEEKMLSVFGEGSDIYKKYMTTILNGRKKLAESEAKANKTTKSDEKAAAEKEAQAILDTMDSMYNKSIEQGKEVGEAAASAISYGMEKGLDDNKLKSAIEKYLQKADIEKALNHKDDDNWYYNQLEQMVDSLEKGSELHDDYYLKLIEGRNKISDNDEKANEKELADAKKKEEELLKLQAKYQASFGSVFTRNEVNGRNGSAGTPRIETEKMEKIIAAKEKLTGYLEQLAEKGMPQSVINELLAMDPLEAVEYARILLKIPSKFESVKNLAERDREASKNLAAISLGSDDDIKTAGKNVGEEAAKGISEGIEAESDKISEAVSKSVSNSATNAKSSGNEVGKAVYTASSVSSAGSTDLIHAICEGIVKAYGKIGALPDLSGVNIPYVAGTPASVQTESKVNLQSAEMYNPKFDRIITLLESIVTQMHTNVDRKMIFSPNITVSAELDGEKIAASATKYQQEYSIRTST